MQTLIIEVQGGVIQHVASDSRDTRVILINWDELEEPNAKTCSHVWRQLGLIEELCLESREQYEHAICRELAP
jgi:hypothetical protein